LDLGVLHEHLLGAEGADGADGIADSVVDCGGDLGLHLDAHLELVPQIADVLRQLVPAHTSFSPPARANASAISRNPPGWLAVSLMSAFRCIAVALRMEDMIVSLNFWPASSGSPATITRWKPSRARA